MWPRNPPLHSFAFLWLFFFMDQWTASSSSPCPADCLCLSQIQNITLPLEKVPGEELKREKATSLQSIHVLCNTGNLTEIPRDFPKETQEIVITNQNIRSIPPKVFSDLKHLRRLILDSNNISTIHPFAFKDLHDMTEISVQNNPLTELPGFALAGIRNVSNVYLGYNKLHKIDAFAFAGSEHITMLLLNNNPIKIVNASAFSGLKHVEFLFLPAGVQTLESDAFNGLEDVGLLKLAYLDLNELAPYTFRGLKNVRTLTVENSDLATIRRNAFAGMRNIGELKINSNKIDRIEDFTLTTDVHKLTIKGSHILQVPSPAAMANIKVRQIVVENNHFPCNCRVLFLLDSPLGTSSPNFLDNNKCISPYRLNGRSMAEMQQGGLLQNCQKKEMEREEKEKEAERRKKEEARLNRLEKERKERKRRKDRRKKAKTMDVMYKGVGYETNGGPYDIADLPDINEQGEDEELTSAAAVVGRCGAECWMVAVAVLIVY